MHPQTPSSTPRPNNFSNGEWPQKFENLGGREVGGRGRRLGGLNSNYHRAVNAGGPLCARAHFVCDPLAIFAVITHRHTRTSLCVCGVVRGGVLNICLWWFGRWFGWRVYVKNLLMLVVFTRGGHRLQCSDFVAPVNCFAQTDVEIRVLKRKSIAKCASGGKANKLKTN